MMPPRMRPMKIWVVRDGRYQGRGGDEDIAGSMKEEVGSRKPENAGRTTPNAECRSRTETLPTDRTTHFSVSVFQHFSVCFRMTHLECTNCGTTYEWETLQNLCAKCQKPLFPVYDLEA